MGVCDQVKKQDVRQMMVDIDKLESPAVTFDDFVEMVTPRISGRDTREEIMKVYSSTRVLYKRRLYNKGCAV